MKLLIKNEKFSCYGLASSRSENQQILIKVSDLPSVNIFYEINYDENKNVYIKFAFKELENLNKMVVSNKGK